MIVCVALRSLKNAYMVLCHDHCLVFFYSDVGIASFACFGIEECSNGLLVESTTPDGPAFADVLPSEVIGVPGLG